MSSECRGLRPPVPRCSTKLSALQSVQDWRTQSGRVWADPADMYRRSYTLRTKPPFLPLHLVMETEPGTCDLYPGNKRFCCDLVIGTDPGGGARH